MLTIIASLFKIFFGLKGEFAVLYRIYQLIVNFPHETWEAIAEDVATILDNILQLVGTKPGVVPDLLKWLESALRGHAVDDTAIPQLKAHVASIVDKADKVTRF